MAETMLKFSVKWNIGWAQFDQLSTKSITKSFITTVDNVPFYWQAKFFTGEDNGADKFGFSITYVDGPLSKMRIKFWVGFGQAVWDSSAFHGFDGFDGFVDWEAERGSVNSHLDIGDRDPESFRDSHGMSDAKPFYFRITMKIPISSFKYSIKDNTIESPIRQLFQGIEDPEKAKYWDAKLISDEGKIFYCHKNILDAQSPEFGAMFRHPLGNDQVAGEYPFPKMSTTTLKAMIEFLYTGKATFQDFSTKNVIDLVDAAEEYELKKLEEACGAWLCDRVVAKPEEAFEIVAAAKLYDDLKYLKHRCLDVLVETFNIFSLQAEHVAGNLDKDLMNELYSYIYDRVQPESSS